MSRLNTLIKSLALCVCFLSIPGRASEGWTIEDSKGSRTLSIHQALTTPDGPGVGTLTLGASGGKNGVALIQLEVQGISKIKSFLFDDFSGPDAPAEGDLMIVTVRGQGKESRFAFCPNGSFCGDAGDSFQFGGGSKQKSKNLFLDIAKAIAEHGETLTVQVLDFKDPHRSICGTYPIADRKAFAEIKAIFLKGK